MASGDTVVSTPFVVTLGPPPIIGGGTGGGTGSSGGGSAETWFCVVLALLGSVRFLRHRVRRSP
jgi:hypothetical protein